MPLIGPYDPAGYIAGTPATYPPLPVGVTLYQPAMWWSSTGVGTMAGQPVAVGDRIYAAGRERAFGEDLFGVAVFGGPAGQDWPPTVVTWLIWTANLPPGLTDPFPYTGCPWGDRNPGWQLVVDAWFNDLAGSRTFGETLFGDSVFGDAAGGAPMWHDITHPAFVVNLTVGTVDGAPVVPVTELVVDFHDPAGELVDFAPGASWRRPTLGTPIRVGLFDPEWRYHPRATCVITRIVDDHDTPTRDVTIEAAGSDSYLVVDVPAWQRPAELASTRTRALFAAAGYPGRDIELYPGDPPLIADPAARPVDVRAELDRTARSAGWFFDADPTAGPRMRPWPHVADGPPIDVADCLDDPTLPDGTLLASRIRFVTDDAQVLNDVTVANTAGATGNATDPYSIARFGHRGTALGFPAGDLATAAGQLPAIARSAVTRFAYIVDSVEDVAADTARDPAWLAAIADLDTGQPVTVHRTGLTPTTVAGIVVGYELRLLPNRAQLTAHTATLTPTY